MMDGNYDNPEIKYLLGSLSESETERLDELSVTDEQFAIALAAAEGDLVDSFVQGELTGPSLDQFRSHYLASPLRRERVEFSRALQSWGEKTVLEQATESQPKRSAVRKGLGWFPKLSVFGRSSLLPRWGFAAVAVILLVAVSWLVFDKMRLRKLSQTQAGRGSTDQSQPAEGKDNRADNSKSETGVAQLGPGGEGPNAKLKSEQRGSEPPADQKQPSGSGRMSIASFFLKPQMRSVGQIPTVSIPLNTNYAAMTLELEPGEFLAYRVALLGANNRVLWRSSELNAKASGGSRNLIVTFGTALLKPQSVYILRVYGVLDQGRSEIVSDYQFKVAK